MKLNNRLLALLLFGSFSILTQGQIQTYAYERMIGELESGWYFVNLPEDIYSNLNNDFSDIRILGTTKNHDTIEAAYAIREQAPRRSSINIAFTEFNRVQKKNKQLISFKLGEIHLINAIALQFNKQNFNVEVGLEGSFDGKNWFQIIDSYRLVSISNHYVSYKHTTLNLTSPSNYKYYRVNFLQINGLEITKAKISYTDSEPGKYITYGSSFNTTTDNNRQETQVEIKLQNNVPLNRLDLAIESNFDYYRPYTLFALLDSFKIDNKWEKRFRTVSTGVLSSLESPGIEFDKVFTNQLQVVIQNNDNTPLDVTGVETWGFEHKLFFRVLETGKFKLIYGDKEAEKPNYDIAFFTPHDTVFAPLLLGAEIYTGLNNGKGIAEEGIKKVWLWLVMGIIVVVLVAFTIKMIKNS